MKIVIVVSGGVVQSVYSHDRNANVEIIDFDQTDSIKHEANEKRVAELDQDKRFHAHI